MKRVITPAREISNVSECVWTRQLCCSMKYMNQFYSEDVQNISNSVLSGHSLIPFGPGHLSTPCPTQTN